MCTVLVAIHKSLGMARDAASATSTSRMRPLPDSPVFTREELRALGWSDSAISRAVRSARLSPLRRGIFARPDDLSIANLGTAAVRDIAGSVLSHRTALTRRGLPVVGARPPTPEITVAPDAPGSAHQAHLHRASLPAEHVEEVDGVLITSVARTLIDVARLHPLATSVAAIDAALHKRLTNVDEIDDVLLRCWNWPGIGRAQRAVRLSDGRAESALESVSRLVIADLGLPAPALQPVASDRRGFPVGRLDFYWDEFGVAGEADGRDKYDGREVLIKEKERQEKLEDEAMEFARWGWDEAWRHPQHLRSKVLRAFERGAARDRSGFPREWSIRWSKPVTGRENVINSPAERSRGRKT